MRTLIKVLAAAIVVVALAIALTACESNPAKPAASERENTSRLDTYDRLAANQPAQSMDYSPTRATKNFWIETWNEPGKLSYVYLQSATGDLLGYYVLEGLPVSYCTSLVPPYQKIRIDGGEFSQEAIVPAPSVDGTYSSGGNCNSYYGKDATTGAYIEYTAGLGINVLLYDEPLPRQDVQPLGQTKVEDVR